MRIALAVLAILLVIAILAVSWIPLVNADEKGTTTPCVGLNCGPLLTVTPARTIPQCPDEWCPWPPVGERCHCPIGYTLIAPTANYDNEYAAIYQWLIDYLEYLQ